MHWSWARHNRMWTIIAKGSGWLRQLQSQLMEVLAVIEDFADNAISIISFLGNGHFRKID